MGKNNAKESAWRDAKKKYRLSNEVIAMAKKLGLNPKKMGGYANNSQQPWKEPLADFIRRSHKKSFGD